ncbi:hypothetical protein K525DRAFT_266714 [Schizophyllum commune Loenen D]|nr:hypothetical protein K525DRAFT_266714 [Schizophyllum commune Loenen D]
MSSSVSHPLAAFYVLELQQSRVKVGLHMALYGIQVALSLAAIALLNRKEGRTWILMTAILLLLASSTEGMVGQMVGYAVQMPLFGSRPPDIQALMYGIGSAGAMTSRLNLVISDALVVWRAWVLPWTQGRIVRGALLFCVVCSAVAAIIDGVWSAKEMYEGNKPEWLSILSTALLLVTNFVTTVLVAIEVWIYRRDVAAWLHPASPGQRAGAVLMILLESGLVYCAFWVIVLIIDCATTPESEFSFILIFASTAPLLAGIYPTFVVVIVTAQQHLTTKSIIGSQNEFMASLRFFSDHSGVDQGDRTQDCALVSPPMSNPSDGISPVSPQKNIVVVKGS